MRAVWAGMDRLARLLQLLEGAEWTDQWFMDVPGAVAPRGLRIAGQARLLGERACPAFLCVPPTSGGL